MAVRIPLSRHRFSFRFRYVLFMVIHPVVGHQMTQPAENSLTHQFFRKRPVTAA